MTETPFAVVEVSPHPLARLFDPGTVRARCAAITRAALDDVSPHFTIERSRLAAAADRVAALTLRRFPDLRIPYHSRWRHFEAGGVDRKAELDALLDGRPAAEGARARFDLTVLSVLLDAGAGARWSYTEGQGVGAAALPVQRHAGDALLALLDQAAKGPAAPPPGGATDAAAAAVVGEAATGVYRRSEGLGVASLRAFMAGVFSASTSDPLRADAATLKLVDPAVLRGVFQVTPANAMVGLEGRAGLISRLGDALATESERTGLPARPGLLYDRITAGGTRTAVSATEVLAAVLQLLSPIFTSGSRVQGLPAGDVWPHRWAGADTASGPDATTGGWVPFHKLGQWLAYSLLEPLQWAGVQVTRPRRADRSARIPQWWPARRRRRDRAARCARPLAQLEAGRRIHHRVACADRDAARRTGRAGAPAPGPVRGRAAAGLHPRRRHLGRWTRTRRRVATRRLAAAEDRQRRHGVLTRHVTDRMARLLPATLAICLSVGARAAEPTGAPMVPETADDPAAVTTGGIGETLASARRSVRAATVWLARGIDSWFGDLPFEDGGEVRA